MEDRTQDQIEQEAKDFAKAANDGLIDNQNFDPPDVAEVANYG